jgi:hypothetical protein
VYAFSVTRASAGILILLCLGCADRESAETPSAKPQPERFAVENLLNPHAGPLSGEEMEVTERFAVESLLNPHAAPLSREEMEAIKARVCADPASACEMYKALREGRADIQLDPSPPLPQPRR